MHSLAQRSLGRRPVGNPRFNAKVHGYHLPLFWIGSPCIDQNNSVEVSEAMPSMYGWYAHAAIICGSGPVAPSLSNYNISLPRIPTLNTIVT